jgi:hypothetical protein
MIHGNMIINKYMCYYIKSLLSHAMTYMDILNNNIKIEFYEQEVMYSPINVIMIIQEID